MRILCATDLLPKSESALDRAGMLAQWLEANLLILHAVAGAEPPYLLDEEMHRAGSHLRVRTTPPRWHYGPTPGIEVRAGSPVQVLIDVAREVEPALVVLGTNRRRFAQDALAGTLAERLLRRLDCPVLIVRRMPLRAYRRVLLVLDCAGSEEIAGAAGRLVLHDHGNEMLAHAHELFCAAADGARHAERSALVAQPIGSDILPSAVGASQLLLAHEKSLFTKDLHREIRRSSPELLVVGAGRSGWLRRKLLGDAVRRAMMTRGSDLLIVPRRRACTTPRQEHRERETTIGPFWLRGRGSTT